MENVYHHELDNILVLNEFMMNLFVVVVSGDINNFPFLNIVYNAMLLNLLRDVCALLSITQQISIFQMLKDCMF